MVVEQDVGRWKAWVRRMQGGEEMVNGGSWKGGNERRLIFKKGKLKEWPLDRLHVEEQMQEVTADKLHVDA